MVCNCHCKNRERIGGGAFSTNVTIPLITLLGWLAAALGFLRMLFPQAYITTNTTEGAAVLATEAALLGVGVFLTFKAYSR